MKSVIKKTCPEPVEWKRNQKAAFSMVEMLVVLGIIAVLVALAIPAISTMQKSYNSTGTESMIGSALATARTLAISHQQYAGVRFQKAGDPNNVRKADQYMIFIIYEEPKKMSNLTDAFRAVDGYKPMKLPENIGIMDMTNINLDANINDDTKLSDATTFSIIFSPAGKLVKHLVQTRNKDGVTGVTGNSSKDDVFNTENNITATPPIGMFRQDNVQEQSRNGFVIYNREQFNNLNVNTRYSEYLKNLNSVYVNAYTGELIGK